MEDKKDFKSKRGTRGRRSGRNAAPKKSSEYSNRVRDEAKDTKRSTDNDVTWYIRDAQMAKDVASFSFNNAAGIPISLSNNFYTNRICLPGIWSMYWAPTPGITPDGYSAVSPINIAAKKIYSFVRHQNSGSKNYDAPDLMIYLMALDSAYSFHAYLVRAYGTAMLYSMLNRFLPTGLLEAQGIDSRSSSSVANNLADFRAYINYYATKLSALALPTEMSYITRHYWMNSNVYMDEDNAKAQFYLYAPAYLYKYSLNPTTHAGRLEPRPVVLMNDPGSVLSERLLTLTQLRIIGDDLLNALMYQEDVGIISGDILKAYGDSGIQKLPLIAEDYRTIPVFNEEVLSQIHNTNIVGMSPCTKDSDSLSLNSLYIEQQTEIGTGDLVFEPYFWGVPDIVSKRIIDTWKPSPTPEDVIVMTRNLVAGEEPEDQSSMRIRITACGSDFVLGHCLLQFNPNENNWNHTLVPRSLTDLNWVTYPNISVFNEHPIMQRIVSTSPYEVHSICGELSNYAIIDKDNIWRLHECALLNQFGVSYNK